MAALRNVRQGATMDKGRFDAFSDGVLAITSRSWCWS
jgi:uncharacterized membrane protein